MNLPAGIRFDGRGLVPVVVQEADSGAVLLLAYMNAQALEATLRTGRAHFWSRSRHKLWRKGESSGREQIVEGLYVNCEENSLLLRVRQQGGAACHTGHPTCYYRTLAPDGTWHEVESRVFDPADVYGHVAEITQAVQEADAGDFATDAEMDELWAEFAPDRAE